MLIISIHQVSRNLYRLYRKFSRANRSQNEFYDDGLAGFSYDPDAAGLSSPADVALKYQKKDYLFGLISIV